MKGLVSSSVCAPDQVMARHGLYAQHDGVVGEQLFEGLGDFAAGGAALILRGHLCCGKGVGAKALHDVAQLVEVGVNTASMAATPFRQSNQYCP